MDSSVRVVLGEVILFRVVPPNAGYAPDSPFPSTTGRFSNGQRVILYVSSTAEGAVAELLRRHPELIDFQDELKYEVFALSVACDPEALDVRTKTQAAKIPFPFERLVSSEAHESTRYRECRELADDADSLSGITYPCVAHLAGQRWNVALFGDAGERWSAHEVVEVDCPVVDGADVRRIEKL